MVPAVIPKVHRTQDYPQPYTPNPQIKAKQGSIIHNLFGLYLGVGCIAGG